MKPLQMKPMSSQRCDVLPVKGEDTSCHYDFASLLFLPLFRFLKYRQEEVWTTLLLNPFIKYLENFKQGNFAILNSTKIYQQPSEHSWGLDVINGLSPLFLQNVWDDVFGAFLDPFILLIMFLFCEA